jgi:hypothetical protein
MSTKLADIEQDVEKICFGGTFVRAKDSLGDERLFVLKRPSLRDKVFIDFIEKDAIKEATENKLLSRIELRHSYKMRGIWHEDEDLDVERLTSRVKELLESIEVCFGARQKKVLNRTLESVRKRLNYLLSRRYELFWCSSERYVEDIKQRALIFSITHTENEEKYWKNWEDMESDDDSILIYSLIRSFSEIEQLSGKRIRELSRSNAWRHLWGSAKQIGDLFNKSIINLDSYQQGMLYWSQVYDNVYESTDCPDDSIIEDDDKLDDWFESQHRKRKVADIERGEEANGIKLSSSISRHGEIFVVANPQINPNAPTTQQVENLNDSFTREFKKKEAKVIKDKKLLNEKDLRRRGNHIARKLIGSSDAVIGKNSMGQSRGGKQAKKILPGGSIT